MSDADQRYQLVWEEARHALEMQRSQLDEVRSRGVAIISMASAAAFVASTALADGEKMHATTWVGVVAFAINVCAAAACLVPKPNWRFHREARALIREYVEAEPPASLGEMHRDLAIHLEDDFEHNRKQLKPLYLALRISAALLVVEVIAFAFDLRGRR